MALAALARGHLLVPGPPLLSSFTFWGPGSWIFGGSVNRNYAVEDLAKGRKAKEGPKPYILRILQLDSTLERIQRRLAVIPDYV